MPKQAANKTRKIPRVSNAAMQRRAYDLALQPGTSIARNRLRHCLRAGREHGSSCVCPRHVLAIVHSAVRLARADRLYDDHSITLRVRVAVAVGAVAACRDIGVATGIAHIAGFASVAEHPAVPNFLLHPAQRA